MNFAEKIRLAKAKKDINKIRKSHLVLEGWYKEFYTDLRNSNVDACEHYYYYGWKEGRRPNPYFDTTWYSNLYSIKNKCPLLHYIDKSTNKPCEAFVENKKSKDAIVLTHKDLAKYLITKKCSSNIINYYKLDTIQKRFEIESENLFDHDWYKKNRPDLDSNNVNLLEHYLLFGVHEGTTPNEFFDQKYYIDQAGGSLGEIEPLIHYNKIGWKTGLNPSEKFDISLYLSNNQDVLLAGVEPLSHYLNYGIKENRSGLVDVSVNDPIYKTGLFASNWYLETNEDLRDSNINPFLHFTLFGLKEQRNPNPFFDIKWYAKKYLKGKQKDINPILHYSEHGWKVGNNPSPKFDTKKYIKKYKINQEPLAHYLNTGKKMGYIPLSMTDNTASQGGPLEFDQHSTLIKDPQLRALIDYDKKELSPNSSTYKDELNIHWVMPDFSPGAGGHMTIFRIIRYLETFGHKNTVWIYGASLHEDAESAYNDIVKHFQLIKADIHFVESDDFKQCHGDVIFATDWGSVNIVNSLHDFKRRFYFVQDHEVEFYAQGSHAISARNTYSEDIDCICASPWLKNLMTENYGRWAKEFWLSVDFDIYNKEPNLTSDSDKFKIAFYARHFTSRRAVELGFLALEKLAQQNLNIEIHCFGAPLPFDSAPFECIDHGICSPTELAHLYQQCDMGIVFSATNYSLIPQEMMACGLPVAELDCDSTRAIFPDNVVTFLSTNPSLMADQIKELVSNQNKLEEQAKNAFEWVKKFTWLDAAKTVENSIYERLNKYGFSRKRIKQKNKVKASVIIPTLNGGDILKKVIDKLLVQIAPWQFEIVVVDSGSTDGTVEFLKSRKVVLHEIEKSQFQHGRTRNLAIQMSKGDYIAVLTQDALPYDDYWLYNMVTSLEHYPNAAGAFGKHFAWPDADPFTKRDLEAHFNNFENHPYCVSKDTSLEKWESNDLSWQQFLHFYSDNNSIMRRSVWNKIPYPEVTFGEDQAWAWEIIKAGYQKIYCKHGAVYHSHNFDEGNTEKRAMEEALFFKEVFGYSMIDKKKFKEILSDVNDNDLAWGNYNNIDESLLKNRLAHNYAKLTGYSLVN
ncbi:glycosyltransferase [Leclercia sp.]|uniref:rhamnosyltransferase WsaF family glycosyltransferase n=1 Tax=Leclercia sp. TaxID=1898428 RepID=UPI00289C32D0|nr:glycosyltransferase [Leclercia sp.]